MAEIDNPDEDHKIRLVNQYEALPYLVKNNGKEIQEKPAFRDWLNSQRGNNEEQGVICYCVTCHLFFYFQNLREKNLFHHENCPSADFAQFCEYCGELYNRDSICCIRQGFSWIKRNLYESFEGDCQDCCFVFPFISTIYLFSVFFHLIMSIRRKKSHDICFKTDFLISDKVIIWLFIPITIVYALVFFVTYMILYIFIMIFELIIRRQRLKDKHENHPRY